MTDKDIIPVPPGANEWNKNLDHIAVLDLSMKLYNVLTGQAIKSVAEAIKGVESGWLTPENKKVSGYGQVLHKELCEKLGLSNKPTIEQLTPLVEQWAEDRGIFEKGYPEAQADKTTEEADELYFAVLDKDPEGIKEEMGDILVTLIIQAKMQGLALSDCLEHSLKKISGRIGRMENGTFVKEETSSV